MSALRTSAKRSEWMILAILAVTAASASVNTRNAKGEITEGNQDDIDDFVPYQGERFNTFDWNLLQNMAKNNPKNGNLLISPISLKLALVLLYEGAQDETAQELATVMHLPVGRLATRDRFSSFLNSLQVKSSKYKLNVGTRIFMDQSILPRQLYGAVAKSFYNTDIVRTNFSNAPLSAETINQYVDNVTDGHIKKLIDDEQSLKDSMMLIVSAMFFKGTWFRQPFSVNDTKIDKFYIDEKTSIQVPFMRATSKFYMVFSEDLNSKILRLPYAGHKYAMFLILPQTPRKLDDVIKKITPFIINKHVWLMQELPVDVMIPKFKFDFTSHLENNLREMGIRDIFDDTATLTGILRSKQTSRRLVVSDVIQKTGIEVSEHGTIAYAASAIEIGNKMSDETFHANQPFLFYIEDESSGTILYMGIVNNPLKETGMPQMPAKPTLPTRFGGDENEDPAKVVGPAVGLGFNERQNFFSVELLQKLNEDKPGNVIVGTSSIKTALMILAEAAAGQTRQEIVSALRLPSDPVQLENFASQIVGSFKNPYDKIELLSAVKLWLGIEVPVVKNYTERLQSCYNGEIQSINFNDVVRSVNTVNDWVKQYTYGRINSIVDPGTLAPDTKMLLTTAIYFKGAWLKAFDQSATRWRCFNIPNFGCQQTPIMENIDYYKYAEIPSLNAQVVKIPYSGERMSMLIVLPKNSGYQALIDLSRDFMFTPLSAVLASLRETEILLQIPRFNISNKIDMRAPLEQLGIRNVFNKNANFSVFPHTNVQVGAIMHNAQIEVSEEGTIASAATGISVIPLMGSTATTFRADRPFIFFLIDHLTNSILFAGRFVEPETSTYFRAGRKA